MPNEQLNQTPRFECVRCGACCSHKDMIVALTGRDISRISLELGLKPRDLLRAVDFYVQSEGIPIPKGLRDLERPMTEHGPAIVALKKNEKGECIFLDANQCLIHPIRPGACRAFPFVFSKNDNELSWGLNAMHSICPGLGQGEILNMIQLLDSAQAILEDLEVYHEFVMEWNKEQRKHTALELLEVICSSPRFSA